MNALLDDKVAATTTAHGDDNKDDNIEKRGDDEKGDIAPATALTSSSSAPIARTTSTGSKKTAESMPRRTNSRRGIDVDDDGARPPPMNVATTTAQGSSSIPPSLEIQTDAARKPAATTFDRMQQAKIAARQADAIQESKLQSDLEDYHESDMRRFPSVVRVPGNHRSPTPDLSFATRGGEQADEDTMTAALDEPEISTAYVVEDTAERDQERIRALELTVQELRERETVVLYDAAAEPTAEDGVYDAMAEPATEDDKALSPERRSKPLVLVGMTSLALLCTAVVVSAAVVFLRDGGGPGPLGPQVWYQMGNDIDGEDAGDYSGSSLAMSANGTSVAIGSYLNFNKTGHVRVYDWDDDAAEWFQLGTDIDGEYGDESGRSVAMSADGKRIAIGAPSAGDGNAGRVRVFDWDAVLGDWVSMGGDIIGGSTGDESGRSVAISADGSRVVVGSDENADNGVNAGHVRVFDWDVAQGRWVQVGGNVEGESSGDRSGFGVGLSSSGDRLAIFAPANTGNGPAAGHIRVFRYDSGVSDWVQLGNDIDGEIRDQTSSWGGVAMSASGDRIALGAPTSDGEAGSVRIFDWDGGLGDWIQVGADIVGENEFDWSGKSISLSADGSRIAIGAPKNNDAAGHVRVYEYDETLLRWIQIGVDVDGEDSEDEFGWVVVMSADGRRLAVGGRLNDGENGVDSGHVRVFEHVVEQDMQTD